MKKASIWFNLPSSVPLEFHALSQTRLYIQRYIKRNQELNSTFEGIIVKGRQFLDLFIHHWLLCPI